MHEGFLFVIHMFLHTYCQLQVVAQCLINLTRWWRESKWNADVLLSHAKPLGKMPGHVSLMFLEENVPVEDIVKPIVWCICLGVTTISLYDYYGKLRQQKLEIDSELRDYYSDFTRQCKTSPGGSVGKDTGGHRPPRIQFVSVENGRTDLVHAARDIAKDFVSGVVTEITQVNFESYHKVFANSNPELLIKFGNVNTLAGYPPWPVHLTEILSLPTCYLISPSHFLRTLGQYLTIEKREGK